MSLPASARAPRRRGSDIALWLALVVATAALLGAGSAWTSPAVAEAWFFAYVMVAGLTAGSLGLLMIGHLLGEVWLEPIRDELEPVAWTMPIVVLLAIPVALHLDLIFPWTDAGARSGIPPWRRALLRPELFALRGLIYLAIWTALAFAIARSGEHRRASAIGLALLAPTASLAAIDWIMSRDPDLWSSLFGFAYAVSQLTVALAFAFLVTMFRQDRPDPPSLRSLERALLTLTLLTFWIWFSQFLIVWMGNLPNEVAWYLARLQGWSWAASALAISSLALAIALLIPSQAPRWRLLAASMLILVHFVAHLLSIVRPVAAAPGFAWADLVVGPAVAFVWSLWFIAGLRWHSRTAQPGR